MSSVRVNFRLYEDSPYDAEVIAWIRQLPRDARGRRRVKEHMVALLKEAIEDKSAPARKIRANAKTSRRSQKAPALRQEASKPAEIPSLDAVEDELPEFPQINEIQF